MESAQFKAIRDALEAKCFDMSSEDKWVMTGVPAAGPGNPLQSTSNLRAIYKSVVPLIATDNKAHRSLSDGEEEILAEWFRRLGDAVKEVTQAINAAPSSYQHEDDQRPTGAGRIWKEIHVFWLYSVITSCLVGFTCVYAGQFNN